MFKFPETKTFKVQEQVKSKNSFGEITTTWQEVGSIQAEVFPLQITVQRGIMGITEKSTHRFFTADNLNTGKRLVAPNGAIFYVQFVQDWDTHREGVLELCQS